MDTTKELYYIMFFWISIIWRQGIYGFGDERPPATLICNIENESELYVNKYGNQYGLPRRVQRYDFNKTTLPLEDNGIYPVFEIDINQDIIVDDVATESILLFITYIGCDTPIRIQFRNESDETMKHTMGLLQIHKRDMNWTNMKAFGNVLDLCCIALIQSSDNCNIEMDLRYFNKNQISTLQCGLANIVFMTMMYPRLPGNSLPYIFMEFEWSYFGEIELSGANMNSVLHDLHRTMPVFQTLEIKHMSISFPSKCQLTNGTLLVPNHLSKATYFELLYSREEMMVPKYEFRRILLVVNFQKKSLTCVSFVGHLPIISTKNNVIENSDANTFADLDDLDIIDISSYKLSVLLTNSFNYLQRLRVFLINRYQAWNIKSLICLDYQNFIYANLSNNVIWTTEINVFKDQSAFMQIESSSNALEHISGNLDFSTSTILRKLPCKFNKTQVIAGWIYSTRNVREINLEWNCTIRESLSPNIAEINMNNVDNSNLHVDFTKKQVHYENETYDDAFTMYCRWDFNYTDMSLFDIVNLNCKAMDDCPINCSCCEQGYDREIVVNCSARNLTHFPSIFPRNIKYLYVDNNFIQHLDCSHCEHLSTVNSIDLHNNIIVNICDEFMDGLHSLHELNLMDNMITHFPKSLTKFIDVYMFLAGNPVNCDCNNRWMHEWLLRNIYNVYHSYGIVCDSGKPKGKTLIMADVDDFICDITISNVNQSLIVAAAMSMILPMILVLVVYKYRGEIKLFIFVHFNWHPFDRDANADITDMEYDVFLSYSGFDDKWVLHELLPNLEDHEPPYRVCIHDRDFELGAAIQENILNSVKNSRRMIMVLTKRYLQSDWCLYEFRVAYDKVLNERTNYLIMILADDVTIDDVEEEMKLYLRTNTYIQMNKSYLWDKILYAMPHKPLCEINKQLKPLIYPKLVKHSGHSELELNFQMSVLLDSECPDMHLEPMETDTLL